jgi:hypothetical protein
VVAALAGLRDMSAQEMAAQTRANFEALFKP